MAETMGRYRKLYAAGVIEGRRINSVSLQAEAWLWRLMMIADDYGNLHAEGSLLAGRAAPRRQMKQALVNRLTCELEKAELLTRYLAEDGEVYIHLAEFEKFQTAANGRKVRRYPLHSDSKSIPTDPAESEPIQKDPVAPESGIRSPDSVVRRPESGVQRHPNGKPLGPPFLAYWHAYPAAKRTQQGKALAAWGECIVEGTDPAVIVAKAIEYAASPQGRSRFAVTAPRFLADRMFNDPPEAWAEDDAASTARPKIDLADPWGDKGKP